MENKEELSLSLPLLRPVCRGNYCLI